jgi:hypothetical protein
MVVIRRNGEIFGYETIPLIRIIGIVIVLWGEFLPYFHQFNPCSSLLLVMQRGCCGSLSPYGFHCRCRYIGCITYESLSRVMICVRATLRPRIVICSICGLLLVSSCVLSGSIKWFNGLWGLCSRLVHATLLMVMMMRVMHGVRMWQVIILLLLWLAIVNGLCFAWHVRGRSKNSWLSELKLVRGRGVVARVVRILSGEAQGLRIALVLGDKILKYAYVVPWWRANHPTVHLLRSLLDGWNSGLST